jgi:hypothetical protein
MFINRIFKQTLPHRRNNVLELGEPQPTSKKSECSYKGTISNFGWKDFE